MNGQYAYRPNLLKISYCKARTRITNLSNLEKNEMRHVYSIKLSHKYDKFLYTFDNF